MNNKYIDLAKKLKALADRGVDGEKINAEKMLNIFMKKHNIKPEDIQDDIVKDFYIKIDTNYKFLLTQIGHSVRKGIKQYGEFPKKLIKEYGLKGNFMITCTMVEYVDIMAKFEFYQKCYVREIEVFKHAFFDANNLLIEPTEDDIVDCSIEDKQKAKRASDMAKGIKSEKFLRQLNN